MPLELIVGAAVGAAAASPSIRSAFRRSMIYGLGGLLVAYDRVSAMAHEAARGARKGYAEAQAGTAANESATAGQVPPATSEVPAAPAQGQGAPPAPAAAPTA
jgi:hypothetical protein